MLEGNNIPAYALYVPVKLKQGHIKFCWTFWTPDSHCEFNFTTDGRRSSGEGSNYLSIDDKTPVPDKYRVELYMDDKLMESIEKDVVI